MDLYYIYIKRCFYISPVFLLCPSRALLVSGWLRAVPVAVLGPHGTPMASAQGTPRWHEGFPLPCCPLEGR